MICYHQPNLSGEHSLNTLRYADRYIIYEFIFRVKRAQGGSRGDTRKAKRKLRRSPKPRGSLIGKENPVLIP
jgi:hypothetical protein